MVISIKKKEIKDGLLYQTELLGQTITLSKRLVEKLKNDGALKKDIAVGDDWLLTVQVKERDGKKFNNFYLTIPKPKDEGDDEIPF